MSLVELRSYPTRIDADLARLALAAEGIEAIVFDAETNNFFGGGGLVWVRLMVIEEELDEAVALLNGDS